MHPLIINSLVHVTHLVPGQRAFVDEQISKLHFLFDCDCNIWALKELEESEALRTVPIEA